MGFIIRKVAEIGAGFINLDAAKKQPSDADQLMLQLTKSGDVIEIDLPAEYKEPKKRGGLRKSITLAAARANKPKPTLYCTADFSKMKIQWPASESTKQKGGK